MIQNTDATDSGRRARFLLPVIARVTGPIISRRIDPYKKKASVEPNDAVKKSVDQA